VACAFLGDEEDNRSLGGVKINVVMGRDAGWLTAASVLARRHEDAGPHLIYVPERPFSLEAFANEVDAVVKRIGRCVVAVSEGVRDAAGKPIVNTSERDSHGNLQLSGSGQLGDQLAAYLKAKLGLKRVRADTLGYLQRSFAGCVSKVDAAEAFEVGRTAAKAALKGKLEGGSVALLRREGKKRYEAECAIVELSRVAKVTRPLDAQFLAGSSDVSPEFAAWLSPLVGELPVTERLLHKSWKP
jgi:6-phosphofructokinase 1